MITSYLLDTHIVIWLLSNDKRLDNSIREDIVYYQHQYHVSQFSLLEIVQLQQLKRIELKKSFDQIIDTLRNMCIAIDMPCFKSFRKLEEIPILTVNGSKHSDMIDRYLISEAVAENKTLISADQKFPCYRKFGLRLLEAK